MSMICELMRLPEEQIDQLLANPNNITALLNPHAPLSFETGPTKSLEKMWHALHFLLTGAGWEGEEPLCYLIAGGTPVGDIDLGYGPARVLRPLEVKAFADAIEQLSEAELRNRFNPAAMSELQIYPMVWDEPREELFEELMLYLNELKSIVNDAVQNREGLLIWLG